MMRRWTQAEDAIVENNWGMLRVAAIARLIGRSAEATWVRAGKLRLGLGCPRGYEYLWAAARRAGYDTIQLRAILAVHGVRLYRCATRPSSAAKRRPTHYVDPYQVDAAVAAWHRAEPVESGARRHAVSAPALRKWLRLARWMGVEMPPEPKRYRAHWRIPSVTIDHVVAQRARLETMSQAASRVGVSRQALAKWLHEAGVPRTPTKYWFVLPEVANDVVAARRARRVA